MAGIPESIRKRLQAAKDRNKSSWEEKRYVELKAGQTITFRVLPGEYGEDKLFFKPTGKHYLNDQTLGCPHITNGSDCPICQLNQELRTQLRGLKDEFNKSKDRTEKETLADQITEIEETTDDIYPRKRWLLNVLVRGDAHVSLFDCPKPVFDYIFDAYAKNADDMDLLDVLEGFDFKVTRTGDGINTKYESSILMKACPVAWEGDDKSKPDQARIDALLAQRYNLDECVFLPSVDQLTRALNGEKIDWKADAAAAKEAKGEPAAEAPAEQAEAAAPTPKAPVAPTPKAPTAPVAPRPSTSPAAVAAPTSRAAQLAASIRAKTAAAK